MVCLGRYFSDWSKKTLWGSFVRKQNLILFLFCPFMLKRSFNRRMKSVKIYKNCKCRYLQDFELYHGRPQSGILQAQVFSHTVFEIWVYSFSYALFRLLASLHLTVDGNVLCLCLKDLTVRISQECQASSVCDFDCFVLETTLSFIFYFQIIGK